MSTTNFAVEETKQITASVHRDELIANLKSSLDFLAMFILTELYAYGYCKILKAMWQEIVRSAQKKVGKDRFALGIPRGFSKTILLKLYVVWVILFTERKFILVVCATEKHAFNFIADVKSMLNHINIKSTFGDWTAVSTQDSQAITNFSFRGRDIILAGLGAGGSPRGLNINFVRPDIVIMDDIQKKEEASNDVLADELMVWMLGTLMKACDPHVCTYIFVGNMYPYTGSLLRKLKESKEWFTIITGAITAEGESIWPEHRSVADLLEELRVDTEQGHPEVFFSEVMNDEEAGTVSGIDVSKIPMFPLHFEASSAQGGFVVIDPSLGKKTSDDVAIGVHLVFDGVPVLWELDVDKYDPGKCVQQATLMALKYNIKLIVVEGVAYQQTLVYWFNFVYKQLGISGMDVRTISPGGIPKNTRIRDWLKLLLSGKALLHKQVRSAVIYQITQWNPLKTKNKDDVLDVGSYGIPILAQHQDAIAFQITEELQELPPATFSDDLAIAF